MAEQISGSPSGMRLVPAGELHRHVADCAGRAPASDSCRLHSSTRDFPERARADRSVSWLQSQEQIPAGEPRPRLLDVCQDRIAYFTLQRILLSTSGSEWFTVNVSERQSKSLNRRRVISPLRNPYTARRNKTALARSAAALFPL